MAWRESGDSAIIELSDESGPVNWLTFESPRLYNRHFYSDFYDLVLGKFAPGKKVLLRGTAGIGALSSKSRFCSQVISLK